ncbi:hypothetical protein [Carboxylicivirga marina]|uniref:hypothetical protein n=1 Tax=Carboxylicivirga marina TaxID=2800988 RepID=UPI002597CE3C|nr:hypothetical protein [uncultured Carboxylicivirga sp.]
MNKEKWDDKQVVSLEWMKEVFNPFINFKPPLYRCSQWQMVKTEYGFNSWLIRQIINVAPDLNLVMKINADNRGI